MKKMTKKMVTLLTAIVLAVCSVPATVAQAAREPYCFPNYSHELGADVIDYFEYGSDGIASANTAMRLIKDGSTLQTGSGDIISKNYKAGSTVSWFNSNKAAWQKNNDVVYVWDKLTKKNIKIASNAECVVVNSDYFASKVRFKNGKTEPIASLIKEAGSGYNFTDEPGSSAAKEVITSTDGGKTTVMFGGNKIESYKAEVYYNGKQLSKYCKSGIRYLAVTKNGTNGFFIFVYEDDDNILYRFDTQNIYNPVEIDFSGELKSATFDALGYGSKLVTTSSATLFAQLHEKEDNEDKAFNKPSYSTLFLEEGGQKELRRKGSNLYLDNALVTSGIKTKKGQFGFLDAKTLTYVLAGNQYSAPVSDPLHPTFMKSGVKSLTYSSSNGFVNGTK